MSCHRVHCSQNSQLKDEIDGVEQERDHLQARSSTPQLRHAGHVCQTFQQLIEIRASALWSVQAELAQVRLEMKEILRLRLAEKDAGASVARRSSVSESGRSSDRGIVPLAFD